MKKLKLKSTKLMLRSETIARLNPLELTNAKGGDAAAPGSDTHGVCSPHTPGATIMTCG